MLRAKADRAEGNLIAQVASLRFSFFPLAEAYVAF
jgi:hypothetical protein